MRRDLRDPPPHRRVAGARIAAALGEYAAVVCQLLRCLRSVFDRRSRQKREFVQFLFGESQPASQFRLHLALTIEIDRDVHQGTGRGDLKAIEADAVRSLADGVPCALEIRAPDIAAINHPQREQ